MRALAFALPALAFALNGGAQEGAPPVLPTTYGDVIGELQDGVRIWRSIPFAAPPIGALRFSNPVPHAPWVTPRDVTAYPTPCAQMKVDGSILFGGEDCLQLSVFAPENAANLPVLFWIFGGAFVLGDSEELGWYDGAKLAKDKNCVVVSANYRVGPFGFLALNALLAEDKSTGNAALLDQVLALEWTRDNVAAAGGDPSHVTIFGESAGAFSVAWHMVSPRSAGLFHGAILESGTFSAEQFFQPLKDAVAFNELYSTALGCAAPPSGGDAAQLVCLRELSTEAVLLALLDMLNPQWPFIHPSPAPLSAAVASSQSAATAALLRRGAGATAPTLPALAPLMPWGPAIDGVVLTDIPLTLIKAGTFNKVPVLLGTNKNEGSIFIPVFVLIVPGLEFPPRQQDIPHLIEHAFNMYPADVVRNATAGIVPFYPESAYFNDSWSQGSDMLTHAFFACANRRAARALAPQVPVFLYQFSHTLHWPENDLLPELGDYHTSELDFVFGHSLPILIHDFNAKDKDIEAAFEGWWRNFASTGDPNNGTTTSPEPWPRFIADGGKGERNMQIEIPFSITTSLLDEECDAWDEFQATLEAGAKLGAEGRVWQRNHGPLRVTVRTGRQ